MSIEAVIDLMSRLNVPQIRSSDIRGAQAQADKLIDEAINNRGSAKWSARQRAVLYSTSRLIPLKPIWQKYGYEEEAA